MKTSTNWINEKLWKGIVLGVSVFLVGMADYAEADTEVRMPGNNSVSEIIRTNTNRSRFLERDPGSPLVKREINMVSINGVQQEERRFFDYDPRLDMLLIKKIGFDRITITPVGDGNTKRVHESGDTLVSERDDSFRPTKTHVSTSNDTGLPLDRYVQMDTYSSNTDSRVTRTHISGIRRNSDNAAGEDVDEDIVRNYRGSSGAFQTIQTTNNRTGDVSLQTYYPNSDAVQKIQTTNDRTGRFSIRTGLALNKSIDPVIQGILDGLKSADELSLNKEKIDEILTRADVTGIGYGAGLERYSTTVTVNTKTGEHTVSTEYNLYNILGQPLREDISDTRVGKQGVLPPSLKDLENKLVFPSELTSDIGTGAVSATVLLSNNQITEGGSIELVATLAEGATPLTSSGSADWVSQSSSAMTVWTPPLGQGLNSSIWRGKDVRFQIVVKDKAGVVVKRSSFYIVRVSAEESTTGGLTGASNRQVEQPAAPPALAPVLNVTSLNNGKVTVSITGREPNNQDSIELTIFHPDPGKPNVKKIQFSTPTQTIDIKALYGISNMGVALNVRVIDKDGKLIAWQDGTWVTIPR